MSGVYIKGIEIPGCCSHCICAVGYDIPIRCDAVPAVPKLVAEFNEAVKNGVRTEWCPLIPVPDHGRLVDADAFREEMDKHYPFDKFTQSKHGEADAAKGTIIMMLANAPTIIPADKEGEA